MMSDFYRKLDEAEIRGRAERVIGNRPENLHDYQGCANSAAQGVGPCGPGPYKWFRCQDCGFSGEITMADIAQHRSQCATGTTEPLAEQARAAEQGQETPKRSLHEVLEELCPGVRKRNWPAWAGPYMETDKTTPVTPKMTQDEDDTPTQPPAGDVVERMMQQPLPCPFCGGEPNVMGMDFEPTMSGIECSHCGIPAVRRDDGESSATSYEEAVRVWNIRARLAKPAERVTVGFRENKVQVYLDNEGVIQFKEQKDAERYAAGLREELRDGREGK